MFSFLVAQCSDIKDYYTPEALNLERQRQSGVFTVEPVNENELPRYSVSNADPDTLTMISLNSEHYGINQRRAEEFSDVPLN